MDQDSLVGNWKPVIVADKPVAAEICTLEDEIEMAAGFAEIRAKQYGLDPSLVLYCTALARLAEEEDVTQFLNELGWFFQRSYYGNLNFSLPTTQVLILLPPFYSFQIMLWSWESFYVLYYFIRYTFWFLWDDAPQHCASLRNHS